MGNYFWRNCLPSEKNSYIMKANNGFLAIGAKARLSQNPDVGIRIYGLPHVKWILHNPPAKGIDRAATISDRSRT